jgi:hypothetical protein
MQYVSQITMPRLVALFAFLSVAGWLWAALDGDMPVGFAFLLCVASPVLLLVLTLYWTLDKGLGDWSSHRTQAPPQEQTSQESATREEVSATTSEAEEPSLARR